MATFGIIFFLTQFKDKRMIFAHFLVGGLHTGTFGGRFWDSKRLFETAFEQSFFLQVKESRTINVNIRLPIRTTEESDRSESKQPFSEQ